MYNIDMLTVFYSNTTLEGHRRLYEKLASADTPTSKHVFLVPDRFTLGVERDIIERVFHGGFSRVDVASFTRFAVKNVGKRINKCLSKEGTVVLLEKILEENAEKLRYFKKVRGYNFAKELFAAVASLRTAGITPDDIERASESMDGGIKDKLFDISVIMREYDGYIKSNFSDTITRIDGLIDYVSTGAFSDTDFYILGFNIFSAQQLALLQALCLHAKSVSVSAVKSHRFFNPAEILSPLTEFCREKGIEVKTYEATEITDSTFSAIRESIFGGKKQLITASGRVRPYVADAPDEEISSVAREIVYLTRRENLRYKDIAVVCNNSDYIPYVRETFERFDIPCFIDSGYNVADGIAVKYLFCLLDASEDYAQDKMLKLIRHPYCGFSREEIKIFTNYCLKYNIKYDRFISPFTLGDFAEAERIRLALTEKLTLPQKGMVSEYCEKLISILDEYAELTDGYLLSSDARVVAAGHTEKFRALLDEMKEIIPNKELTVGDMRGLLKNASADLKTVLSPDNFDVVFVGNTDESRFSEVKAMFVIGANDGYFPKKSGDGLIFTAMDNEFMARNGLTVFPSPIEKNRFEQFVVYDLLSKGMERLYISRANTDLAGDAACESDGFREIVYAADVGTKPFADYRDFTESEKTAYFLATDKNAYKEYVSGSVPQKYAASVKKYLVDKGLLTDCEIKEDKTDFDKCFRKNSAGEYVTSVSQLETYFKCPYRHFLRYGLRAEEPDDAALKPNALGTAIHNVLEKFLKNNLDAVYENKDLTKEIKKTVDEEFEKPDYESFRTDPVSNHILNATQKECYATLPKIMDNLRASEFRPEGFEVAFGYQNSGEKILINVLDKTFRLCGKIDRVDGKGNDVIIIDYKTGSVDPDLKGVYCGEKIQLYAYLNHYLKAGRNPVGVFYLPIKSGADKKGKRYAYVGQMLNSAETYEAIDGRVKFAEEGSYVSPSVDIKAKIKNGEIKFTARKNLIERQDFNNVVAYVEELMKKGLAEILDGYTEKKPLGEACKYCPYKKLCGTVPARKISSVEPEKFDLRKENDDGQRI